MKICTMVYNRYNISATISNASFNLILLAIMIVDLTRYKWNHPMVVLTLLCIWLKKVKVKGSQLHFAKLKVDIS